MARRRSNKIWWNKPCVKCGYNLRGLRGDPVRCPECGFLNPRTRQPRIKSRTDKRVRQLEPRIRDVLVPAIAAVFGVGIAAAFWVPLGAIGTIVAAVIWWRNVGRFRQACESRPGWLRGLIAYHLPVVPWLALAGAALIVRYQEGNVRAAARLVSQSFGWTMFATVVLTLVFARWGRRRIAQIMELRVYETIVREKLDESDSATNDQGDRSGQREAP